MTSYSSFFQNILPVNWFNGLAVDAEHLIHSDNRVSYLYELFNRTNMQQPGLLEVEGDATGAVCQLVRLGEFRAKERCVSVTLQKTFYAAAPSGQLLIGIKGQTSLAEFTMPDTGQSGEYLLCMANNAGGEAEAFIAEEKTVRPKVFLKIVSEAAYCKKENRKIWNKFIPIAKVVLEQPASLSVISNYAPPVSRLELVNHFSGSLLIDSQQTFSNLIPGLKESFWAHVEASRNRKGKIAGQQQINNTVVFLQQCSTLVTAKSAFMRNLSSLSPRQFLFEILYPITELVKQYGTAIPEYEELRKEEQKINFFRSFVENDVLVTDTFRLLTDSLSIVKNFSVCLGMQA